MKASNSASKQKTILDYHQLMFHAPIPAQKRVLIGVPMTGLVRSEWAFARMCQIIPCNWSASDVVNWLPQSSPIGYAVAEARNIIVDQAVREKFEWLFFLDHDVVLPPTAFVQIDKYITEGDIPVVSGLYFAKAHPPSPLVYRGRGNGSYGKWNIGDKVWADGAGMGCVLINVKLLTLMWHDAKEYIAGGNKKVRKVFDTPFGMNVDPEKRTWDSFAGTEDLAWYNRVIAGNYLAKAGFKKIAKQRYPFLVDTSIFCKHMTNDGMIYPLGFQNLDNALFKQEAKKRSSL